MQIDLYDDSSLNKSPKKNWVEKKGGLPGPVRARARAIKRKHPDWTLSHCIAVAINAVKYSAATGDSKLPGKQKQRTSKVAAHRGAAAKWEAMKGGVHLAEKMGSKSAGVTSTDKLEKAKKAFARKKKKMSPQERKKTEARLKSSQQRLGQKVGLSSDLVDGIDLSKKVFFKNRRTPEIVPDGQSPKTGGANTKAGKVVKVKKVTADDKKKMKGGKWLREDKDGKKPGDSGYLGGPSKGPDANKKKKKKVNLAVAALARRRSEFTEEQYLSLANTLLDEAKELGISVDLAVSQASAAQAATQPRQGGGRFGNRGGKAAVGGSNNSATGQKPQDFQSLVKKLKDGQSITLPNTKNVKIKKVAGGYQVFNGKENVLVKTFQDALSKAQAFGREEKGGKQRDNLSNTTK